MNETTGTVAGRRSPGIAKRAGDLVLASLALAAGLPVILALAALVRLTSRGPAFDPQIRLGQFGQPFRLWKLRTRRDLHVCGGRDSLRGDPRLTVVGQFLKAFHLDALPTLWNVVRGDMSFVGPKPDRPELLPMYEMSIREFPLRMLVRPGLTGLAQVCLPPGAGLPGARRRVEYDLHYVRHASLWLDVRLFVGQVLLLLGLERQPIRLALALPSPDQARMPASDTPALVPVAAESAFRTPAQLSA